MDGFEAAVSNAIGDELRRAREGIGWTRAELVDRLPSEIHVQTLATYERGTRQCTVVRFVEICRTIGVSAPEVLRAALQRAKIDLPAMGLQVDLQAVINDKRAELLPLRRWARNRAADDPSGSMIAHLDWSVVQEMATMFGIERTEFVDHLTTFTPQPVPRRR